MAESIKTPQDQLIDMFIEFGYEADSSFFTVLCSGARHMTDAEATAELTELTVVRHAIPDLLERMRKTLEEERKK
jgi:hypothetical protein